MRRVLVVAVIVAAGLACIRVAMSARPRVLCAASGRVHSPLASSGQWVAWLEGDEREGRLMVTTRRGGRSREVLSAPRLAGLALDGDVAYVTRVEPDAAESDGAASREPAGGLPYRLLAVSLKTGATSTAAIVSEEADQIVCSDRWIVWRRSRRSGLSSVPFIAAAAPVTAIRSIPRSGGATRVVAALRGKPGLRRDDVVLLGIVGDEVYWQEETGSFGDRKTAIRRAPCAGDPSANSGSPLREKGGTPRAQSRGGRAETVVAEPGSYSAAVDRSALVWTGPSLEAGNPSAFAAVKRMALGGSGVEVMGDWLEPGAVPMSGPGGRVYAQERGALWRLSAKREEQRKLFSGPPQLTRPRVVGDEEFMFVQRDGRTELAKRPLTRWAMIRSAAGL